MARARISRQASISLFPIVAAGLAVMFSLGVPEQQGCAGLNDGGGIAAATVRMDYESRIASFDARPRVAQDAEVETAIKANEQLKKSLKGQVSRLDCRDKRCIVEVTSGSADEAMADLNLLGTTVGQATACSTVAVVDDTGGFTSKVLVDCAESPAIEEALVQPDGVDVRPQFQGRLAQHDQGTRDAWDDTAEANLNADLKAFVGLSARVDCRGRSCRIDITSESVDDAQKSLEQLATASLSLNCSRVAASPISDVPNATLLIDCRDDTPTPQ